MALEQSELHKQVFGESDDDDLSDLGEVHFSDDGESLVIALSFHTFDYNNLMCERLFTRHRKYYITAPKNHSQTGDTVKRAAKKIAA